nr:retrotransposon Orf1 [Tanacetum cinerariifolium]
VEVEIPKQNDKPARRPVKYAEMYRTQRPRGYHMNWNNLKSRQLGSNFVMNNKACYVCGSFNHLQARCKYHQRERMGNGTNHSWVNHNANTVPKLIEECSVEVPEQQKQNMEKTMLDLVKICHHKQFLFMHDNVDDLIESALDYKLLSIKSINFQRLDKKEQEVKIVEEQPAERRNRAEKSLQNFRENGVEEENVVQREEEEVEDISQVQDVVLREKLLSITRLISNIESLNDNSTPDRVFNSFEFDNSLLDNYSHEFETFCDHSEETRS